MTITSLALGAVVPEIILTVVACSVLLLDLYLPVALRGKVVFWLTIIGLIIAAIACLSNYDLSATPAMNGLVTNDAIGDLMKVAVCVLVLLSLIHI